MSDSFPFQTAGAFHRSYEELKERFHGMEEELSVTVRDPAQGVEGYVVVWNTAICRGGPFERNGKGCGKGGTRVLPDLELKDVKRLARAMAEKNAAAGLPLGGAKSGLRYDSSAPDYEEKYRRFVKLVQNAGILAEHGGIFGGFGYDIGGRPPHNAHWACDELGSPHSFTGKPAELGGTDYDREGIAGLGVAAAARTLLEEKGKTAAGTRFAVQGTGAMGSAVIRYFSEYGGTLHSLADPKYGGTWLLPDGASTALTGALAGQDTETASALLQKEGRLLSADCQDVLYQHVDMLFPCALEDVITVGNAGRIKAPFISEGANNPTHDDAHEILFQNGTIVIPDIIANAGGIIAAYVELTHEADPEENARTRVKTQAAKDMTERKIADNVRELLRYVDILGIRPDKAGDYMAYRNIFYGIPSL